MVEALFLFPREQVATIIYDDHSHRPYTPHTGIACDDKDTACRPCLAAAILFHRGIVAAVILQLAVPALLLSALVAELLLWLVLIPYLICSFVTLANLINDL